MCAMPEPRIHENLRDARRAAKIPQHRVAAAIGIADTLYSRVERGKRPLKAIELWRAAQFLELDVASLFETPTENAAAA